MEGRNERNCKRYKLTKKVGKAGLSVQKVCCDGGTREDGDEVTAGVVRGQATRCPTSTTARSRSSDC